MTLANIVDPDGANGSRECAPVGSIRDLQPLTTRPAQVICPSGGWLTGLSSLFFRIFRKLLVPTHPKSDLELFASHPTEGRIAIVTHAGRDAVDAAAFCARWDCRAS